MDLSLFTHSINKAQAVQSNVTDDTTSSPQTETEASIDIAEQAEEFDTFLTLLTAQIRNQDPLEPVDSTQFVEQLATFSNLELQAKNNQILEDIASMLARQLDPSVTTTPSTNTV